MRLDSARSLKTELIEDVVVTDSPRGMAARVVERFAAELSVSARALTEINKNQRSVALGVAKRDSEYKLAIRVQRQSLMKSDLVDQLVKRAKGEVDLRMIGRIDKRASPRRPRASTRIVPSSRARNRGTGQAPWYRQDVGRC